MGGCFRVLIAAVVLLVLLGAHWTNQLAPFLVFVLAGLAVVTLVDRIWALLCGQIAFRFLWHPLKREFRAHRWQLFNRSIFYLLLAICQSLALPRGPSETGESLVFLAMFIWGPAIALFVFELFPKRNVHRPWNLLLFGSSLFLALQLGRTFFAPLWSEQIVLDAPFRGEWIVDQGGRSSLFNHHYYMQSQRYAVDFVALHEGKEHRGNPHRLSAYYGFGEPLFAPADGMVVHAVGDRRDEPIGGSDPFTPVGNHVVLDIGGGKYVLMAHLMRGSVRVRVGQRVKAGRFVGLCGNSGNTTLPHLHIQVQNKDDWTAPDLQTWPIRFRGIHHRRWGINWSEQRGELVRNDCVKTQRRHLRPQQ